MRKRRFRSFLHLIKCFLKKMSADRLDVYSAQSAFYLVMGLIPILMLMLMLLRFTPLDEEMILDALSQIMDVTVMGYVEQVVGNVYHGSVGILSFATVTSLWVASRAILGLTNGLNSIRRVRENRNILFLMFRSMVYTLLLIVLFVMALGILVASVKVNRVLLNAFPIFNGINAGTRWLLSLLGLVLMMMIFTMLYVVLPNGKRRFRSQMPGAIFTTLAWTIYTWIYSIYLGLASNLSIVYGGLASAMGTMLWLYFCLYLFFFGAEINEWLVNPDSFPF